MNRPPRTSQFFPSSRSGQSIAIALVFLSAISSICASESLAAGQIPEEGKHFRIDSISMELRFVPAGSFWMGDPSVETEDEKNDELPGTLVRLSKPFWMTSTEVTQRAFEAVMNENPSEYLGEENLPVENVSWHKAMQFCQVLTEIENKQDRLPDGYVYRLPTEAEWEYVARAGSEVNQPTPVHQYAWYRRNSGGRTQPVGLLKPNAWGFHDMLGNVFEWNLDWYAPYPGGSVTDPPQQRVNGTHRITRGGSWASQPERLRFSKRGGDEPDLQGMLLGFRFVLAPKREN